MFTTKTEMGYGLMTAPTATSATCRFRLFPLVVFFRKKFSCAESSAEEYISTAYSGSDMEDFIKVTSP